jgi:hypothetical protein
MLYGGDLHRADIETVDQLDFSEVRHTPMPKFLRHPKAEIERIDSLIWRGLSTPPGAAHDRTN